MRATAQVDLVNLAQEGKCLLSANLAGTSHECPDVLGQAAAAEAEPGSQEAITDARVVSDCLGKLGDIGARCLADLGHRIDEGDLGRKE